MSKTKNDFEIIFKKLEESKNSQNEINTSQLRIIQEVNDEIEIMKELLLRHSQNHFSYIL
jgi:cellobiose-specific phosphotransferase system component IIA